VSSCRVPSDIGAIVMGKLELPTLLEVVLPSSVDSSRMVYSDGHPL
jgi:hypothetical protein